MTFLEDIHEVLQGGYKPLETLEGLGKVGKKSAKMAVFLATLQVEFFAVDAKIHAKLDPIILYRGHRS